MLLQPPPQGVRAADVDDAVAGVAHLVHTRIVPVRLHRAAAEMPPRCRREWHVSPPLGMPSLLVESSTTERSANSALTQGPETRREDCNDLCNLWNWRLGREKAVKEYRT